MARHANAPKPRSCPWREQDRPVTCGTSRPAQESASGRRSRHDEEPPSGCRPLGRTCRSALHRGQDHPRRRTGGPAGSIPTRLVPVPVPHASDVSGRARGLKRKLSTTAALSFVQVRTLVNRVAHCIRVSNFSEANHLTPRSVPHKCCCRINTRPWLQPALPTQAPQGRHSAQSRSWSGRPRSSPPAPVLTGTRVVAASRSSGSFRPVPARTR